MHTGLLSLILTPGCVFASGLVSNSLHIHSVPLFRFLLKYLLPNINEHFLFLDILFSLSYLSLSEIMLFMYMIPCLEYKHFVDRALVLYTAFLNST